MENKKCIKCGEVKDISGFHKDKDTIDEVQLHCHHIEGYTQNPLLGNDIDNVITLCKACHKEVHKLPGCNYQDLRCKE